MAIERAYIERPPRIQPELPRREVDIPTPPAIDRSGVGELIQMALPLLTVVGFVMVAVLGSSGASPLMVVPMSLTVLAATGYSFYSFRRERRQREAEHAAYVEQLTAMRRDMVAAHRAQRQFYRYTFPDAAATLNIVADTARPPAVRAAETRAGTRLWERRPDDDDFATLRLGIGTRPSTVIYKPPRVEGITTSLLDEALRLAEDSRFLSETPITIPLRRLPSAGDETDASEAPDDQPPNPEGEDLLPPQTIHALGITGDPADVYAGVYALLAQYCTFHAPHDARLLVLAANSDPWEWVEDLPHAQPDDVGDALCFLDRLGPSAADATDDASGLAVYLEGLRRRLVQRKLRLNDTDRDAQDDPTRPFLLLVVDLLAEFDPGSPLADVETDASLAILQQDGPALGAAVIFLTRDRRAVPGSCVGVVEMAADESQRRIFRYAEIGLNSLRYVGAADAVLSLEALLTYTDTIRRWDVRRAENTNITKVVPFLEMLRETSLRSLRDSAQGYWERSTQPERAQPLRVKVGYMSGNKPRTLVLSAKHDGVHGMIAGSTGSGKSELLISLIAALAATYDPSMLNFVLVDYKGGGAFKEFEALPHCVDVITNLQRAGVSRMFTAVNAEMRRRQRLNVSTDTKDILEYHRRGFHLTGEPYPYLFIIIDEFAEMIAGNAQFKAELEMITRLGRAQGVSLVLAAQRPTGITDQMRANIKFRICLRVETTGESREMLRRADAAYLPGNLPGRGYLQVGNDEIELIQAAYSGDPYLDPALPGERAVLWPERHPEESRVIAQEPEPPKIYQAAVQMIAELAVVEGCEPQRAPWPNPLPATLALTEPLRQTEYLRRTELISQGQPWVEPIVLQPFLAGWLGGQSGWSGINWRNYAMRPVVGLVDNPYEAQQTPLLVNFRRGHAAVFGGSGWGKSVLLRTLIVSLAANHSPGEVHVYILDMGGRNLALLERLPHVGAVISPDSDGFEERVAYLLRELTYLVEARQTALSLAGVEDLYQYNSRDAAGAPPLPAVLVAIDNFAEFVEAFGETRDNVESALDKLIDLARQGRPYGIHLVVTAKTTGEIPGALLNLCTERLTLRQSDPAEYRAILSAAAPELDDLEGRGALREDSQSLAFQAALLVTPDEDASGVNADLRAIRRLAEAMTGVWQGDGPMTIGALPKSVSFPQMEGLELGPNLDERLRQHLADNWANSVTAERADWLSATLGIVAGNKPRTLRFSATQDGVHGMIAGGTGSGKSEMLMSLIVSMALRYDPTVLNFVLVDYKGGGAFKPFETLPHCVDMITNLNSAGVRRMFVAIRAEMERRQQLNAVSGAKDIVDYRRKGYHLTREPYPFLFLIIDEYAEMIADQAEFKEELDRITRLGRALGVSLILASQKPTGVSDQMRVNIKFRLCLRVEGVDTSREMLRRSDAAFLPDGQPGRGYLQVGAENLELIQVAYTGENVRAADGQVQPFYTLTVEAARALTAGRQPGDLPRCPWPPFLPDGRAHTLALPDALDGHYLSDVARQQLAAGADASHGPALAPAVNDWLAGQGAWQPLDWQEQALRPVIGLADNPYRAEHLPLILDLAHGHAVIFGASGMGKTVALRSLLISLAVSHAPSDLNMLIVDLGGQQLRPLRDLPHVGSLILPDEAGFEERIQFLVRELHLLVESRRRILGEAGVADLAQYNALPDGRRLPALLVAIDNFAEFLESFAGRVAEPEELIADFITLVRQARASGLHFVITAGDPNHVPAKLLNLFTERLLLTVNGEVDFRGLLGSSVFPLPNIPGRGYLNADERPLECQVALPLPPTGPAGLAQLVTALQAGRWAGPEPLQIEALPRACAYKPLLTRVMALDAGRPFVGELRRAMRQRWHESVHPPEQAAWLSATIGVAAGNKPRPMTFSAKADGVHGIVAGGTGSGKSELLTTLIAGMALDYDPSVLNFVLVDYKGGGAFVPFKKLPHCVDIITNLNQAAVTRMFTAINAEMKRRQSLNAATGTKDIVDYRNRGLHLTHEPYPHLFIIIDEYAEMITDNRDFLVELERITRVGRSLGVSLILASQRPTGVTDQMRSNIKFRICLRVESIEESRELLRKPDAALLPNGVPGRGYLQVGNDELNLIQVAYTGDAIPEEQQPDDAEPPKLYEVIVRMAQEAAAAPDAPPRRPRPWPDFLPTDLTLEDVISADYMPDGVAGGHFALSPPLVAWLDGGGVWPAVDWRTATTVVLGVVDDPQLARQLPLTLSLDRDHHFIFGGSGYGKTSFLRALVAQLAVSLPPDALHVYVLDLGGRSFGSLRQLPHLGDIIMPDDEAYEERLNRLMERLEEELQVRKVAFSAVDAATLADYNAARPAETLPAILVLIDNFAELKENFGELIDERLTPLLRSGRTYGLYFVVTAADLGGIPSRVLNLFGQRLTFSLADSSSYLDVVGRGAPAIGDTPGRGLARVDGRPLAFQAALPVRADEESAGARLRRLAELLRAAWAGPTPEPVRILPRVAPLVDVLAAAPLPSDEPEAILGFDNQLQPARFKLRRHGPHFAIVGPPLSGKTTTLINWVLSLADRHTPEQVAFVLVDFTRKFTHYGGRANLGALPHVLAVAREPGELPGLVARLAAECRALASGESDRRLHVVIDNFDDLTEEIERDSDAVDALSELAQLAGRHGADGLHVIIAGLLDTPSPLKSRVLNSGYGLGLRNSDSLTTLRAYSRNFKDLPAGRGHIASAGQLTLIQVAQPYTDAASRAAELDEWVGVIQARYPGEAAEWLDGPTNDEPPLDEPAEAAANGQVSQRAYALLKTAIAATSLQQGLALTDIGINLDEMAEDDVIRLAESYFSEA
ncbi:MAG: hypothetical protein KIT52_10515 [Anaerolineae bacterium]|nr:hypothetical protein [Anaerolineae bacterium]